MGGFEGFGTGHGRPLTRGGAAVGRVFTGTIDRILARPIRRLLETPRRILRGHVERGMTVLDVGCGTGYYSLGMAGLVGPMGHVVSVDTRAEAIASLEEKAQAAGLAERIEARVSGETDLAVRDLSGRVDFALAVYVLHHAADPARLVADVHRALKSGGKFLVIEPRHHASATEREAIETTTRGAGLAVGGYPRLTRDWAVILVKRDSRQTAQ
jgi:ubiquinone/menaquinone biosynthesis C-methylase UbiE